jgi:hypothetical protein
VVSCDVVRLFLAIWLAAFAVQSSELLAALVPDECVEEARGSAADPCPENCARCVCCARIPVFVPQVAAPAPTEAVADVDLLPPGDPSTSALPRGILHVPKTR